MQIGVTMLVIGVLIAAIWLVIEIKRMRHKLFAVFLIALILFTYISFSVVLKNEHVDLTSVSGIGKASKLYVAWLGSAFSNIKAITSYATKQDWSSEGNQTPIK